MNEWITHEWIYLWIPYDFIEALPNSKIRVDVYHVNAQTISAITFLRRGRSLSATTVGEGFKEKIWFQLGLEEEQHLCMLMETGQGGDLPGGRKEEQERVQSWDRATPCRQICFLSHLNGKRRNEAGSFSLFPSMSASEFSELVCYQIRSSSVILHN